MTDKSLEAPINLAAQAIAKRRDAWKPGERIAPDYLKDASAAVHAYLSAVSSASPSPPSAGVDAVAVREALQTSLSEMLEARDRLLCYHARTSGLDHGIEEARRALAALAPAAQAGTVAQEGER